MQIKESGMNGKKADVGCSQASFGVGYLFSEGIRKAVSLCNFLSIYSAV